MPQLWAPGCCGPSIPITLPGPFQMPRLGEVRSGLCLGDGSVFYSAQLVFMALPGTGERRRIWIFFQNSVQCLFPCCGCVSVFYERVCIQLKKQPDVLLRPLFAPPFQVEVLEGGWDRGLPFPSSSGLPFSFQQSRVPLVFFSPCVLEPPMSLLPIEQLHQFRKHVPGACTVPGTVLGREDGGVKKS